MTIEQRNGSITRSRHSIPIPRFPWSILVASVSKTPLRRIPSMAAMKQNRMQSTLTSMYSRYASEGGTKAIDSTARTADTIGSGCFLT